MVIDDFRESKTKVRTTHTAIVILLILGSFNSLLTVIPQSVGAAVLFVGGIGPGNFTTIQQAIDAANSSDTVYVYAGTYYEHITISKPLSLEGEDRDTVVVDGLGSGDAVHITANWVNISKFTITNAGSNWDDAGIELRSAHYSRITHSNISGNNMHGIYAYLSNQITVSWNNLSMNRWVGIFLDSSNGSAVENNRIYNNSLGARLWFSSFDTLRNNSISSNVGDGVGLFSSGNNTLSENGISTNGGNGVSLVLSNGNIITNTIASENHFAIYSISSAFNTMTGNVMKENGIFIGGDLSQHWNTHNIDLSNSVNGKPVYYWKHTANRIVPPGAGQVILANCTNVSVENQVVSNGSVGIELGFSSNNTVLDNKASSGLEGIFLWASNHNRIVANNVSSGLVGVVLFFSENNTVRNNEASGNFDGISLYFSNNSIICDNNVTGNSMTGLNLNNSFHNIIYHNFITGNLKQAIDDTSANQWDNGYPSGGNYWSDYLGTDSYRGINQDIRGSDGIGDTPYMMDSDSMDRFPFVSPGTAYPSPPGRVSSVLSGYNFENVTSEWDPSPDESAGLVKGYDIYRGKNYNTSGSSYVCMGGVPNGTYSFVDALAGEGNTSTYFYMVCAVNATDNLTCADNQAGKFTRPLPKGPNLVSIPLIQSDESIQTVLQTVSYDNVWSYDPINQEWKSHMKSKPYGQSLEYVNHTMGLWANVTQDSNLAVAGVVPTSTTIDLQAGWNLVGFPSFDGNYTVADLKAAVAVEGIEGYDGSAPPYFLRVAADVDFLQAGFGYWIRVGSEASWTAANS